jgi:hypothetical protein
MSDERKNSRLPPPAFPPGARKVVHRNNSGPSKQRPAPGREGDEGAFISPDDPLPQRGDTMSRAFISPDDPMPVRRPDALQGALISPEDPMPARAGADVSGEDGVVMGMGSDAHMEPEELVTGGDPHVIELVEAVRKLAEGLKRKGEAGLRSSPSMSRFEATLRAYCVGYLAGRRAEDDAEHTDVVTRSQQKLEPPDL